MVFCLLSFPQNERKIYKLRQLSLSQFVYFLRDVCLLFNFWMIKFTFIIPKLKSKHTSLKKYTNWDKLSCLSLYIFLSFWGNERRQKTNIPHPSPQPKPQERSREASPNPNLPGRRKDYTKGKVLYAQAFTNYSLGSS